jgi:hypothetical protein
VSALEAVRAAIRAVDDARGELGNRRELMRLRGKLMQIRVLLERRP